MRLQHLGLACLAGALCVGELTAGPRGGGRGGAGAGGGRSVGGGQSSPGVSGRSEPGRTGGAEAGRAGGFNGANDPGRNNPGNDPGRGFNNDLGRNSVGNNPGRGLNNDPGRNNIGTSPGVGAAGRPGNANDLQGFLGLPGTSGARAATTAGNAANWNPHESLSAHAPANQPFTPSWYADHPNAFQAQYPHADAWAAATPVGLGRWLNVPVVATGGGYGSGSTTYVESAPAETTTAATDTASTAPENTASAAPAGDWMTIGVYGFAPVADKESHRMLQLVVNRDGVIKGSHYDLISDETQDVQGQLDKNTQHVNWTIGAKGSVVFDATLGDLTKDQAIALAKFTSGKTNQWKLTKANNPSTSAPAPANP